MFLRNATLWKFDKCNYVAVLANLTDFTEISIDLRYLGRRMFSSGRSMADYDDKGYVEVRDVSLIF